MSLVAIVVLWAGYGFIVVGYDRLKSGTGPIKPMLWPQDCGSSQLHVTGASASAYDQAQALQTAKANQALGAQGDTPAQQKAIDAYTGLGQR